MPKVGSTLPDVAAFDDAGDEFRLQGLRGRKETRQLEDLYRQGMEAFREGQEERALVHDTPIGYRTRQGIPTHLRHPSASAAEGRA